MVNSGGVSSRSLAATLNSFCLTALGFFTIFLGSSLGFFLVIYVFVLSMSLSSLAN